MASMYELEDQLPRLPVPPLTQTVNQLLTALKPLLSSEEYLEVYEESAHFLSDPTINLIQKHLESASANPEVSCYLNAVTGDTAPGIYGELRGDTLPRNPYLVLAEDPYSKALHPPTMCERAASLVNSTLKFVIAVRNETLKPDVTPKNGKPLTMRGFRNLFGCTRIPAPDSSFNHVTMYKYNDINDSRHIIIICNNQYYKLELLTLYTPEEYAETKSKHKIWFNDHELSTILQQVVLEAEQVDQITSNRNSVGCLTTQSFGMWKDGRAELLKSNAEQIRAIDDALFVLVLDPESKPVTDEEKTVCISHGTSELVPGTNIQRGTCTSRWYDKLQLIVAGNATAGIVWESASMDSTAILRFISDIYTDSVLKLAKNINGHQYTLFDPNTQFVSADGKIIKPEPEYITFNFTPELSTLVRLSETRLADLVTQHEYVTSVLKLDSHLISKVGLSVDSVLQIAFQVANYSLYGRMVNTLEPITTRKFRDSRTELIPIQNDHITNLVKLFITSASQEDKWNWFKKCCETHHRQYLDAMQGRGFERHLMALTQVCKRSSARANLNSINPNLDPIPDLSRSKEDIPLLTNPLMSKISSPELLISNCGNPALHLFGIPPAIDQGYGIGYIIQKDRVLVTMCSKYRQARRLLSTVTQVLGDFRRMLVSRSDFVMKINDSSARKLELQRLRIQKELKNVRNDSVALRRPIELTTDRDFEEYESSVERRFDYAENLAQKSKPRSATSSAATETTPAASTPMVTIDSELSIHQYYPDGEDNTTARNRGRSDSQQSIGSEEYDILGGYGYFDIGEVELRSEELSRNESYLNSRTTSQFHSRAHSRAHSRLHSRRNSNTDLHRMNDLKEKHSLSERIRDRLVLDSDDNFVGKRRSASPELKTPRSLPQDIKARVGRQLDVRSFE
ncbi:hypothetical protein DIURU_001406 [Diutina rugosa]|uniref:Choline/carnitine acyltransferase domain-containing protein n=1 Tax=Diutina rugosa TaxID=5481 RepID=A0A642UU30_DIURU|nr:uncharacterized protein DIURU_001406 [Diutina rugosa]KAA8905603.1 hypothetical protein DIURU_001406 [Diutina rugosa]